jgi:glyoxylase-like metal-dependent hydrolase (beta-lactamase superfamily II)
MPELIDVLHLDRPGVIAAYLLDADGPALVDCGPQTCADALERGLAERGLALADVRRLVLTHIHPDHAGAAGTLVRRHPALEVHVHEVGAPHLVDPARLLASARRLYGTDFDRMFGEIEPMPEPNVHVLGERVGRLRVVPTPGHAWHHVALLDPDDGDCYPGDAAGVLMRPGRFLYPASAPPEIDVEAWERSLDALERLGAASLWLPHFGRVEEVGEHLEAMRARLRAWAARVEGGIGEAGFAAAAQAELEAEAPPQTVALYAQMPTFEMSFAGLRRYFDRKEAQAR